MRTLWLFGIIGVMKIIFASDHAGFTLKEKLVPFVEGLGYEVEDMGAEELNNGDDYPDFISKAAAAVSKDPDNVHAIILGGSGQGEAIVANRFPNVRAVVFYGMPENSELNVVMLAREHNDANILSLGARFLNEDDAREAIQTWLDTPFSAEERHVRRIKKIEQYP